LADFGMNIWLLMVGLTACFAGDVLLPDGGMVTPLSVEQMSAMHGHLDRDADGKASLDEVMHFWTLTRRSMAKKAAPDLIEKMDLDKDGKVSLDDIFGDEIFQKADPDSKALEQQLYHEGQKFMLADENNDHYLDETEVSSFFFPDSHDGIQEQMASRLLELEDLDNDGQLSKSEFMNENSDRSLEDFRELDADKSGRLDKAELVAWESGKHHATKMMRGLIAMADQNGDSHISKSELEDAREAVAATPVHEHLEQWASHHEL